jgi:hypothetical protein
MGNENDGARAPSAEYHSILPSRSPARSQRHRNAVRLLDYVDGLTALWVRGANIVLHDSRNVKQSGYSSGTGSHAFSALIFRARIDKRIHSE